MWLVPINDNKDVVLSNLLLSSMKIRLSEKKECVFYSKREDFKFAAS